LAVRERNHERRRPGTACLIHDAYLQQIRAGSGHVDIPVEPEEAFLLKGQSGSRNIDRVPSVTLRRPAFPSLGKAGVPDEIAPRHEVTSSVTGLGCRAFSYVDKYDHRSNQGQRKRRTSDASSFGNICYHDISSPSRVAIPQAGRCFKGLLDSQRLTTSFVDVADVKETDFSQCSLIQTGADTQRSWGGWRYERILA
jgi:hypothetical protein